MYQDSFHLFFPIKLAATVSIVVLCIFSSCEKDPEPFTTNSAITGRIQLDDVYAGDLPVLKIVASGPYGSLTTGSDKDGRFWFKNVGNGTYTVECSYPGYGSIKHYSIQVFGNDTANVFFETMYKLPELTKAPEITNVQTAENNYINVTAPRSNCETDYISVRFFLSTDKDVSSDNYQATVNVSSNWQCIFSFPLDFLLYVGEYSSFSKRFKTGEKIFITAYACNGRDFGYLDTYHNKLVFNSLIAKSKSNTVSFLMP